MKAKMDCLPVAMLAVGIMASAPFDGIGAETPSDCVGRTVNFGNNSSAAVTNLLTRERVPAGTTFRVALYHLPDSPSPPFGADFDRGTVLLPTSGFAFPGLFAAGTRTTPATTSSESFAWFQVRVWESVFGTNEFMSYEEARDTSSRVDGRPPLVGRGNVVRVRMGNPCPPLFTPPGALTAGGLRPITVSTNATADLTPPTLICPPNLVTGLIGGQSSITLTYLATAFDDADPAPVVTCSPRSGSAFPAGLHTVLCAAQDTEGNRSYCTFTVMVGDQNPPLITCPPNVSIVVTSAEVSRIVTYTPVASDDAGPPMVMCRPVSGSAFPSGTTPVQCTAVDLSGNSNQCTFTVTVTDLVPPVINCPSNLTVLVPTGTVTHAVQFAVTGSDETDGSVGILCLPTSGTAFPVGTTRVNCATHDRAGNTNQCSFFITVFAGADDTPPVITCPTNLVVGVYTGQVSRIFHFDARAVDDMDPAPVVVCQPPSGFVFPLGQSTVVCIARDFSSNSSQCSFTVTVMETNDHTPPVLTCPNVREVTPESSRVVNFAPGVTDDIDLAPVVTCEPPSGSTFPRGDTLVMCSARDRGSNVATCSFVVTVAFVQGCGGTVDFGNVSASAVTNLLTMDRVPAGTTFRAALYYLPDSEAPPSGADFDGGTVLWPSVGFASAGIFAGGTRTVPTTTSGDSLAWFQVRVWESVFGTNEFMSYEEARDTSVRLEGRPPLLGRGNVVPVRTGNSCVVPPSAPGALIAAGLREMSVSTNSTADLAPPTLICSTNIVTTLTNDQTSAAVTFVATVFDDADPAPTLTCTPASGSVFPPGFHSVQCLAQDAAGNRSGCAFTVMVRELVPPLITCPTNLSLFVTSPAEFRIVTYAPTASDNSGPPVVTCVPTSGSQFAVGTTPVRCTAVDAQNNSNQCHFLVTVAVAPDLTPPVITCPSNILRGVYAGDVSRIVSFHATAVDDVDQSPVVLCQPPSGSAFPLGTSPVTCMARDSSSNANSCTFTVTVAVVVDHTPPVLTCTNVRELTLESSRVVNFAPVITDDIDLAPTVTCEPPSGSAFPRGETIVTCSARDRGSNTAICSFVVTVSLGSTACCGTVNFGNNSSTRITNALTGEPVPTGNRFLVALHFLPDRATRPTDADFDEGLALGRPGSIQPAPGLYAAGTRTAPVYGGAFIWLQVRVWESMFGTNAFQSFDAARASRVPVGGRLPLLMTVPPIRVKTSDPVNNTAPFSLVAFGLQGVSPTNARICLPPPSGLVAWWTGDGNADDLVGGSPGLMQGTVFGQGMIGQAFRFVSPRTGVALPDTANLRLSTFTVEAWVRRENSTVVTRDNFNEAALFSHAVGGFALSLTNDGRLFLSKVGHSAVYSQWAILDTNFHHVAVTKAGSNVVIYVDGIPDVLGPFDPGFVFSGGAAIGARGGDFANTFLGTIDEVGIYNRALSGLEIQGLANAGLGKCLEGIPPAFVSEPRSQTICPGTTVTFAARAAGSAPLAYQWLFRNEPVSAANSESISIPMAGPSSAGPYAVIARNSFGAITSAVATLALDLAPPMLDCPTDMVTSFTGETGAVVVFTLPVAADSCSGVLPAHCVPPSGSLFPLGRRTVVCAATDADGNTTMCRFAVMVNGALGAGSEVRTALEALARRETPAKTQKRLQDAVEHVNEALALFADETHLTLKHGHRVFDELSEALKKLASVRRDKKSEVTDEEIEALEERLVQMARLLAVIALQEAAQAGADPKKLAHDWADMDRAAAEAADGKRPEAVTRYRQVWRRWAQKLPRLKVHRSETALRLEVLALPGEVYAIEASTNLVHWTLVGTRTADPDGVVTWDDSGTTPIKSRFYRARATGP